MLHIATPVILPSASKPNRRLAASPRGNISFHFVECLVVYLTLFHDFGADRRRPVLVEVVRHRLHRGIASIERHRRGCIAYGRSYPPASAQTIEARRPSCRPPSARQPAAPNPRMQSMAVASASGQHGAKPIGVSRARRFRFQDVFQQWGTRSGRGAPPPGKDATEAAFLDAAF